MNTKKSKKKPGRPKGTKKQFRITCEILPPGTLKRNYSGPHKSPSERWEEVLNICSEIIAESNITAKILIDNK